MPTEVIMPKVDMDMTTGRLAAWHVAEGERTEAAAPLFDIETDKATMEVDSPATGTLHHITAEIGAEIPIGTAIAWIYADGEPVDTPPAKLAGSSAGPAGDAPPEAPMSNDHEALEPASAPVTTRLRATPAARHHANRNALELTDIRGSGPRGRVQRADVEAHLADGSLTMRVDAPVGGPLAVLRSGPASGTPIVMLHGFASDGAAFRPIEAILARTHPVIRIDLPGHGSSPLRTVRSFADLVSDVRTAFDALDLSSVHLVGHSLGGAVALALADTRVRSIAGLSLICPAGLGPDINGSVLSGITRAQSAQSLAPWLRQLVADPRQVTDSFVRASASQRADPEMRRVQAEMQVALFPDGTQAFDLNAALSRLSCPTRIIWGKSDPVIPWAHAMRASGQVALHLFEKIGHLPHHEMPEQIAALLTGVPQ